MKVFGKTLTEYFLPIWPFALVSILVVISQYTIALPLDQQYPFILNITQWAWELMVALAVITLARKYKDFNLKNAVFIGVFFSLLIHGLKVSIRYFFYERTGWYLIDRFVYGSSLVMLVAVGTGIIWIYVVKKKTLKF